ncbi:MAG TPA: hypothetical protein PLW44_18325, partial [Chitinophagales bacterium]|nr:hypothetical protein [Chitinophagales bacterium]
MKRLFTLAIIALSFLSASAQQGLSVLNLRISDNSPFKLYIDGSYAGRANGTMRIDNMQPGKHMLQVTRINRMWGSI